MKLIQSAVFRLTLSYLGIIMVLSLLFSVALYRVSYDQVAAGVGRQENAINHMPVPPQYQSSRADFVQALEDQLDDIQRRLVLRLAALNLATLLLGGGAAYYLARRTLLPIQEAMEAQGRFTADASHELRTPLTAMRSEIEVALRDKRLGIDDARQLLDSNLEEIAKLEALSAGLLRLARFENGLDPKAVINVPVKDLFESAIDRLQVPLSQHNIELDVQAGAQRSPCAVWPAAAMSGCPSPIREWASRPRTCRSSSIGSTGPIVRGQRTKSKATVWGFPSPSASPICTMAISPWTARPARAPRSASSCR
jgi:signal transduction histidine kinase